MHNNESHAVERRRRLFLVDPQSYNNLSVYDTSLMSGVEGYDIAYFHNEKYQCERLGGVDYRGVFSYSDKKGILKALSYVFSILKIAMSAIVNRPDVVHIQWFRLYQVDKLLLLLFRALGVKIVHTAHNVLPHNPKATDRKHYGWYYSHSDALIVHTQRSKEELVREFDIDEDRVHVIPHGILPSAVNNTDVEARMAELKEQLRIDDRMVFASMGFQNYYKGIDIISDVWKRCPELNSNPHCLLLVVGKVENADITTIERYDNVCVVNQMTSDVDFDAYLRLADVALLPYRQISQSGVLLTALQRGIPVAVADVGGLTDPFRYAKVGWNMGEATTDNLQNMLLHLIGNPDEVTAVRNDKEAFETVRKAFSWKSIGALTSQLYDSLK